MNMTLDGVCDHTKGIANEELHQHYTDLLNESGLVLYGRTTYRLMEYWRSVLENPTGDKSSDDFAVAIDRIPKVVFSRTLSAVDWESAALAERELKQEVRTLRQQPGKDILVGSPGLIVSLTELQLIDEYQLCIHPVIAGGGMSLFGAITHRIPLKLIKTKTFGYGAVTLYYTPQ